MSGVQPKVEMKTHLRENEFSFQLWTEPLVLIIKTPNSSLFGFIIYLFFLTNKDIRSSLIEDLCEEIERKLL